MYFSRIFGAALIISVSLCAPSPRHIFDVSKSNALVHNITPSQVINVTEAKAFLGRGPAIAVPACKTWYCFILGKPSPTTPQGIDKGSAINKSVTGLHILIEPFRAHSLKGSLENPSLNLTASPASKTQFAHSHDHQTEISERAWHDLIISTSGNSNSHMNVRHCRQFKDCLSYRTEYDSTITSSPIATVLHPRDWHHLYMHRTLTTIPSGVSAILALNTASPASPINGSPTPIPPMKVEARAIPTVDLVAGNRRWTPVSQHRGHGPHTYGEKVSRPLPTMEVRSEPTVQATSPRPERTLFIKTRGNHWGHEHYSHPPGMPNPLPTIDANIVSVDDGLCLNPDLICYELGSTPDSTPVSTASGRGLKIDPARVYQHHTLPAMEVEIKQLVTYHDNSEIEEDQAMIEGRLSDCETYTGGVGKHPCNGRVTYGPPEGIERVGGGGKISMANEANIGTEIVGCDHKLHAIDSMACFRLSSRV